MTWSVIVRAAGGRNIRFVRPAQIQIHSIIGSKKNSSKVANNGALATPFVCLRPIDVASGKLASKRYQIYHLVEVLVPKLDKQIE